MFRKYFLYVAASLLLIFAVGSALYNQRTEPDSSPPIPPPTTPFANTVAGLGMVEPSTEASGTGNIAVGSQVSGVVAKVHVRIGEIVKAGSLLFELDARQAEADLKARQTALRVAQEQLRKLELQPRLEEVTVSEALVEAAEVTQRLQKDQFERGRQMLAGKSIALEDFVIRQEAYHQAQAQVAVAKANLALLKAGAWEPDKATAAANVEQARAQVEQARTTRELLQVRAPVDGTILQIGIRPGEYIATAAGQSCITMGNLQPMHIRVNIDEEDLPRLMLSAPARAKIRGDASQREIPLTFVRLEPLVIPKMSLTGINVERVDTRVVQVIYAIDGNHPLVQDHKILVGQLLDVFIDARPTPAR